MTNYDCSINYPLIPLQSPNLDVYARTCTHDGRLGRSIFPFFSFSVLFTAEGRCSAPCYLISYASPLLPVSFSCTSFSSFGQLIPIPFPRAQFNVLPPAARCVYVCMLVPYSAAAQRSGNQCEILRTSTPLQNGCSPTN